MLSWLREKNQNKQALFNVIAPVAFWSYDLRSVKQIPDAALIEAVLLHGNDPLRQRLLRIYSRNRVKRVWERNLVIKGKNFLDLNKKIASNLLHISEPEKYIAKAYSKYNLYARFSSANA
jgi:hypothetical protein